MLVEVVVSVVTVPDAAIFGVQLVEFIIPWFVAWVILVLLIFFCAVSNWAALTQVMVKNRLNIIKIAKNNFFVIL